MMKAKEAIGRLDPEKWASTTAIERLCLLEQVRDNLKIYGSEIAASDSAMKNGQIGEALMDEPIAMTGTVVPMANTVSACMDLYNDLVHGQMLQPLSISRVKDGLHDVHVFPQSAKDKLIYVGSQYYLRVKGEPKQVNPLTKPAGIIAVLGAGNYSSSLEMMKAMFLENCAVVHKPHPLNQATDRVWAKVMKPLVDHGVLNFCSADQGPELTSDDRLSKIYFTGGTGTAKAIMAATKTELVLECGGNDPCIIVPGDRPWTDKEIRHQALQIATISKLNGGSVCARIQTLVTSKHWPQREEFLDALRRAIRDETPAAGTYYPGSDKVMSGFRQAYPDAEILKPEGGRYQHADFMLITGVDEDGYATSHEAFCQIIDEVPLDVPADAEAFLPRAVEFCNRKLLGTLACCILIDDDTKKAHDGLLRQAITDLSYGGIGINAMPIFIFYSPYLTWGGNEEGQEFASGRGNFGNLLCFENVEKSYIESKFVSIGHWLNTNKAVFDSMNSNMARYSVEPTWANLARLVESIAMGHLKGKDF